MDPFYQNPPGTTYPTTIITGVVFAGILGEDGFSDSDAYMKFKGVRGVVTANNNR